MNLAWLHLILFSLTALFALLEVDYRFRLVAVALQYMILFWVVSTSLSVGLALVKLIVGLAATILLGAAIWNMAINKTRKVPWSQQAFRLISGGMMVGLAFSFQPSTAAWLPVEPLYLRAGIILSGCGILMNGFSRHPLIATLGLLEVFSGFELVFAFMVNSVLMTGLLALVTLGLAAIGAYLTIAHQSSGFR
ncbi:hypothetical protein QYE77_14230 [Thermanaerothrix sp. 4228-RoL]|jgi:hypothetical protein|uniref:Uncharacterized protein n=1 Tax=Thermanaerothrix solaris TaxID=3058434 RepID=A0ABU3NRG9_9CHLR|nr:hypothetical protein [Thermanaerothrix sp. 4228-RoL]MDT8899419.1 hypothetical protein [Thermanaerothrix sp. 4228-RoL]